MDFALCVDKLYDMFINDFWFDKLKPNNFKRDEYGGIIGYYFEDYCSDILGKTFDFWKYPPIKFDADTKIIVNKQKENYCDLYFRQNKKILIGEMKSTSINSKHREGFTSSLFQASKQEFYDAFGLRQLIKYMRLLREHASDFDVSFPKNGTLDIYPVIVLNEKLFKFPLISAAFQEILFKELKDNPIDKMIVRPITIFHLSDLEDMREMIANKNEDKKSIRIWDLLKSNMVAPNKPSGISYTIRNTKIPISQPKKDFISYIFDENQQPR